MSPRATVGLLAAALGVVGCAPPEPAPPPAMELVGARAIRIVDGVALHHFGPDRPPAVRVEGEPGAWRLALGDPPRPLPTRVERLAEHRFLVAEAPADLAPGPLTLSVFDGDRALAEWPIGWGPRKRGGITGAAESLTRALGRWGALEGEIAGWQAVGALNRALDRPTEAARALRLAAWRARVGGWPARARTLIESAAALDAGVKSTAGQAHSAYARAWVELRAGELRAAEAAAAETVERARAARMAALERYALALQAVVASAAGHHGRAREVIDGVTLTDDASADLRLTVEGNRGWVLFEGWRRGAIDIEPAAIATAFRTALAAADGRPDEQANQHANLAALARMTGDRAALDRHIAAHDALDPGRRHYAGLFVDLLDGHRALMDGDGPRALARFEAVDARLKARVDDPAGEYAWQVQLGRARALKSMGDGPAALAAYRAALAVVDRTAARAALQTQRALYFADQGALFDEAFAAALAEEDLQAAFTVADAARARVVRDLEVRARLGRLDDAQRAEWTRRVERYLSLRAAYERDRTAGEMMAADRRAEWERERQQQRAALRMAFDAAHAWLDQAAPVSPGGAEVPALQARLGPDEGLWLVHRRGDRWHGFLVTADGFAHRVGSTPLPDALPDGVRHLALVGVPPSAAPALWARVSTAVWTHAGAVRPAAEVEGGRVVIGDPDQSLPGARAEAEELAGLIDGHTLMGGAVDRDALQSALTTARVVHFAGHGVLVPASPWDAHLRLADDQRLTTEDALMTAVKSRLVVLSSCETGQAAPLAEQIGLSLADALVAAGAGSVLAAERPVPDAAALALMRRFYAEGGLEQPAEALRRAALAAKAAGDTQWDAFRLRGAR